MKHGDTTDDRRIESVLAELGALRGAIDAIGGGEASTLVAMARAISGSLAAGHVVFTCGNGGSAADAQHIAGELVGRFRRKKTRGYRAFALTTNSSVVTALANDFGYDEVFARQLEAMGGAGDVLLALSTSGDSLNVVAAVREARALGMTTLAFSGAGGGALAGESHLAIVVPHDDFARIQELHMALGHILCGLVEEILTSGGPAGPDDGPPA
ncbi:MAG: SIS domain-containing protein [Candidatus Krumholzibacteria bacterium]|nr:SIS domain-containing protein [Candidatus Krumholzibacteria bacterium]